MFDNFCKRSALAAVALGLAAGGAQANGIAYMGQQSAPVWWGAHGVVAILDIQYDQGATVPLTVKSIYVGDVLNNAMPETLDNCGTPIKSGDSVVAHSLAPGQHCFLESPRFQGDNIYGEIVVTDNSTSFANMQARVRAMLEVRDGNNNVLTHSELR